MPMLANVKVDFRSKFIISKWCMCTGGKQPHLMSSLGRYMLLVFDPSDLRTQSLESHSCDWLGQLLRKCFKDISVELTISIDQTRRTLEIDLPCYNVLEIVSVTIIICTKTEAGDEYRTNPGTCVVGCLRGWVQDGHTLLPSSSAVVGSVNSRSFTV